MEQLIDFLQYLLTPAGIGAVIYFGLEYLPHVKGWFEGLVSENKRLLVFALSLVLPLIGLSVGTALGYYVLDADAVYHALKVGIEAFAASQLAHTMSLGK